ncbi:Hypothetical predicted protein [Paramuricea clavata]|uniref:Uncharacterized protein n=1 Tax=Paramuricea clavata TaxID=317549 RepID=A0A6S7LSV0_PARCT|nr:Hypothetical predicted protein [Paramuricea clavata]
MNGLIHFDFDLTKNEDIHEHYTRHRRDLHLPRAKTHKGKQRPTYQASIDFNNLERELKNATSLHNFKILLKRRRVYERITQGSIDGLSIKFYEDQLTCGCATKQLKQGNACVLIIALEKLRLQNTEVITILLGVARTLARQGLAFRGDGDDTEGNFHQITRLVSRHNPSLKHWLERKDMRQFQTEFIQLLADAVREDIVNEVSSIAGMFGHG